MSIDNIRRNPAMRAYFDTLPTAVQEHIIQCGSPIADLQGLIRCARAYGKH